MTSILSAPYFHDEQAAYDFIEGRIWANGRVCPKCGVIGESGKLNGKSTRIGVYKCYACRKPFTVKVGTVFESSHIPMRLWLQAIFLIASSKKGISTNQLQRTLGITIKAAWFLTHRIREAMKDGSVDMFGVDGGAVEVDETFIGRDFRKKPKGEKRGRGFYHKSKVVSLVDRSTGRARSIVVDRLRAKTLYPILNANIAREARLMTDEASYYQTIGKMFAQHGWTLHGQGNYVNRKDNTIHTNTVEGFFSIFKRGMKGIYQHCNHNHLHRYVTEFDFRYNNRAANGVDDVQRAEILLRGVVGKRLTYRTVAC
ncbi:IS1595 family transposase [Betaproteobacteria bacterium GR16-43]|nr:IS1595 family transposase [Betaproteobacteria bacterium GR16-43]